MTYYMYGGFGAYLNRVTHWMPLPEPPELPIDRNKEMEKDIAWLQGFTQALEQRIIRLERDLAILKSSLGAK